MKRLASDAKNPLSDTRLLGSGGLFADPKGFGQLDVVERFLYYLVDSMVTRGIICSSDWVGFGRTSYSGGGRS